MGSDYQQQGQDEVLEGLGEVLSRIEGEIQTVTARGAACLTQGELDEVEAIVERVRHMSEARDHVEAARSAWQHVVGRTVAPLLKRSKGPRPTSRNITPTCALRRPILRAIVALGGSGRRKDVLRLVGPELTDAFTGDDLVERKGTYDSYREPRWFSTAQRAYKELQENGLAEKDTPHGVWAITEAGREALEED